MHGVYNVRMVLSVLGNNLTRLWVYTYQLSEQMCSKGEVPVLNQAAPHKGTWGNGSIVLFIIHFVTGWRWMVSCLSPLNHQGKSPQYLLTRRLDGPWSQSCLFGKDKNLLSLPGIEPWFLHQPASILVNMLFQLHKCVALDRVQVCTFNRTVQFMWGCDDCMQHLVQVMSWCMTTWCSRFVRNLPMTCMKSYNKDMRVKNGSKTDRFFCGLSNLIF